MATGIPKHVSELPRDMSTHLSWAPMMYIPRLLRIVRGSFIFGRLAGLDGAHFGGLYFTVVLLHALDRCLAILIAFLHIALEVNRRLVPWSCRHHDRLWRGPPLELPSSDRENTVRSQARPSTRTMLVLTPFHPPRPHPR